MVKYKVRYIWALDLLSSKALAAEDGLPPPSPDFILDCADSAALWDRAERGGKFYIPNSVLK